MSDRAIQLRLGAAALLISAFLLLYAIPAWVATPSNVRNIVLSPLFWPQILAGLTGAAGLGLLASARASPTLASSAQASPAARADGDPPADSPLAGYSRLALMAAIMIGAICAMPGIGMVWTCMAASLASALLLGARRRAAALASALGVPLALYFFFAHVAGVAIPQGELVRLP